MSHVADPRTHGDPLPNRRNTLLAALAVVAARSLALPQPKEAPRGGDADACVTCHQQTTPNIVSDWKLSRHSQVG